MHGRPGAVLSSVLTASESHVCQEPRRLHNEDLCFSTWGESKKETPSQNFFPRQTIIIGVFSESIIK